MSQHIVFFDEICVLCSWSVRFIFKNDPEGKIYFASFQSDAFHQISERVTINSDQPESVIFLSNNNIYNQSSAVLKIVGLLRFPWPILKIVYIIPKGLRDAVYRLIARNRYRWFGKRETCFIPSDEMKKRYLG